MAKVFNMISGGGSGEPYAAIGVSYPVGDICTCSNGSITMQAKDTSGYYIFFIPANGSWTVTCGSLIKTVIISSKYQFEPVYFKSVVIIDENTPLNTVTGNIQYGNDSRYSVINKTAQNTFTFTASSSSSSNHERCWQWKTPIDCSLYRYLRVRGRVSVTGSSSYFGLGSALVTSTSATATHSSTGVVEQIINNATDYDTYDIDIHNLSSQLYIGLRTTYTSAFYIRSIELMY